LAFVLLSGHRCSIFYRPPPPPFAIRPARNITRIARVVRDQIVCRRRRRRRPSPLLTPCACVVVGSNRSTSVDTAIADAITAETVDRGQETVSPTSCICTRAHPDFTTNVVVVISTA